MLRDYFQIQQLRYGDGIRLNLNVRNYRLMCWAPKFFLQPLVENSIFQRFFHEYAKWDHQYFMPA